MADHMMPSEVSVLLGIDAGIARKLRCLAILPVVPTNL